MLDKYIEDKDIESFMNDIKQIWKDYDKSQVNASLRELRYSLKGIEIKYNNLNIYSNFLTKLYKDNSMEEVKTDLLRNNGIMFKNLDLVFKNEVDRNTSLNSTKYSIENFNINNHNSKSKIFIDYKKYNNSETFAAFFISKNNEYANSELKEYANYGLWINDYIYVYSIKNKGIYLYNAINRQYLTIVEGNEEFKIVEFKDYILKYDDKQIKLK